MSGRTAAKKTLAMCKRLASMRGGSAALYFADAIVCGYRHGASPENYFVLRFFEKTERERGSYLTSGRSKAADLRLNRFAKEEERQSVADKYLFNRRFSDYVKRDYVYAAACEYAEFLGFVGRHAEFFIKPVRGTQGRKIERLKRADILDLADFYARCRQEKLLLEEPISQHPELCKINPSSVNSVRVNAARDSAGKLRIIGACLKCAAPGAVTDNFHAGGIAYPIDLEAGIISGAGRSMLELTDYDCHPGSGLYMPGFRLPFWPELIACVRQSMEAVPSLGYIGFDIAISHTGPELIEGNINWPGGNIIQFDNIGKYPIILECLGDEHE